MTKILLTLLTISLTAPAISADTKNEGVFAPDRQKSVLGQDGVTPIPVTFKNGGTKYLWTFGDTILGGWKGSVATTATLNFSDVADMKGMPCNSLALSDAPDEKNYKNLAFKFHAGGGKVSEFIGYKKNEDPKINRLWADDGIQVKDKIYVFYMDIRMKKSGDFDFLGTGLAVSKIPENPEISKFSFDRSDKFYAPGLLVGDSVIKKGKYLYLLGRLSKKNDGNLNALSLARVKPGDLENFSAWRFLTSKGKWEKEEKAAIFDDISGEASLAWDERAKLFRVVYMSATTQEIKEAVFKKPEDLVSAKSAAIYKPDSKKDGFYYSAKEIFQAGKTVYLIYIDPSIYQPILVRYEPKY